MVKLHGIFIFFLWHILILCLYLVFKLMIIHQPRHCPNKIQGIKSDTLSVLGASPLKKPVAPSSFVITLKQSIIPLYDWTLPKLSLAWWKPCTFKKWGAPLIDHHYIFNVWHCSYDSQEELSDEWFTCITMGLFCLLTWSDPWLPCGECHETHFWSCSPKNDNETRNERISGYIQCVYPYS